MGVIPSFIASPPKTKKFSSKRINFIFIFFSFYFKGGGKTTVVLVLLKVFRTAEPVFFNYGGPSLRFNRFGWGISPNNPLLKISAFFFFFFSF